MLKGLSLLPSLATATAGRLIAAGPVSKQPGTLPYRVVLWQNENGGFVVHNEGFDMGDGYDLDTPHHTSFNNGNYFDSTELVKATKCFGERVIRHAEYLASLYREAA